MRLKQLVLVLAVGLALIATSCGEPQSDASPFVTSSAVFQATPSYSTPDPTLDPDDPVVVGEGPNTARPSGEDRSGLDATDDLCDELKRDLEDAITQTLKDLRDAGMPSDYMPSRSELKKELSGALRANGCSGF
jgi:hypothetical protein